MIDREQYTPGPANVAHVQKQGDKWMLILVRELRHPPEKVWQALTDPQHLREWAPFDADASLATRGATVKLTTAGAPAPRVTETTVTRADAPKFLEYTWGLRHALAARSCSRQHAPDALAPTSAAASSPWVLRDGTSASTSLTGFSPVSRSDASPAPKQ